MNVRTLYARVVLWLIRPALRLHREQGRVVPDGALADWLEHKVLASGFVPGLDIAGTLRR